MGSSNLLFKETIDQLHKIQFYIPLSVYLHFPKYIPGNSGIARAADNLIDPRPIKFLLKITLCIKDYHDIPAHHGSNYRLKNPIHSGCLTTSDCACKQDMLAQNILRQRDRVFSSKPDPGCLSRIRNRHSIQYLQSLLSLTIHLGAPPNTKMTFLLTVAAVTAMTTGTAVTSCTAGTAVTAVCSSFPMSAAYSHRSSGGYTLTLT